jgi:hypothetical protein
MPKALASFVASGGTSPGVLLVIPQNAPIREVVEALILIWTDDRAEDWRNLIAKVPLQLQTKPDKALAQRVLVVCDRHIREALINRLNGGMKLRRQF